MTTEEEIKEFRTQIAKGEIRIIKLNIRKSDEYFLYTSLLYMNYTEFKDYYIESKRSLLYIKNTEMLQDPKVKELLLEYLV
jgi:hypothetical protein